MSAFSTVEMTREDALKAIQEKLACADNETLANVLFQFRREGGHNFRVVAGHDPRRVAQDDDGAARTRRGTQGGEVMKFDAEKGDRGWVYDADGNLLPYPISGDTVTGEVVCLVVDPSGLPVANEETGELRKCTRLFKAPLRVEYPEQPS